MDIQVSSVVAVQIALTEREAQEFIADPSAVQKRVYELLFPVNSKTTKALTSKSKRAPKATARKSDKRGRNYGTFICPHCNKVYKRRKDYDKHVVRHQVGPDAGIVAD